MMAIVLPIVLGFIIGYGTNYLAIVMLFRPYRRVRILGVPVQGIFPKLQPQFADQAGKLVEEELFNADAVQAHLDKPETRAALRAAVEPTVGSALVAPLGSPRELLARWGGPLDADAMVGTAADVVADSVQQQLGSPAGRAALRDTLADQLEGILQRPLGDVLHDMAPADPAGGSDDAVHDSTDSSDALHDQRARHVALIRRLVDLPGVVNWLASSDLPRKLADSVTQAVAEQARSAATIASLLPEGARDRVVAVAMQRVPDLQRLVSESLETGRLRTHVMREATDGLRAGIEKRFEPETLLGKVLTPDRLLGMTEGMIEKLPARLAKAVRADGASRALGDLVESLVDELLTTTPVSLQDALEPHTGGTGRWVVDRIREVVGSASMQRRVAVTLEEEFGGWLESPAGDVFARLRRDSLVSADDTPEQRSRRQAEDLAQKVVAQIDLPALRARVRSMAVDQLTSLLDRPLGSAQQLLEHAAGASGGSNPGQSDGGNWTIELAGSIATQLVEAVSVRAHEGLGALGIRNLVRETVSAWPPEKLEQAVQQIAQKHLRFVTWLGGALGAMIGASQILLQRLT